MWNMLLLRKSFLIVCLFFTSAAFSQVTEKWVARKNGNIRSIDVPNGLAIDHNGNVYVTGRSQGKETNDDYTTVRYGNDGDKKWESRYNGNGNSFDEAVAIVVDSMNNAYVTGWSTGNGTGRDFATVKYDENGNRKWVKRYNGPGNDSDEAVAIAVDRMGNVYVTGWSTGSGTDRDFTTIKYDGYGNTKWIKRYNGPCNKGDQATSVAVDEKGNVYVCGWSTAIGTGGDITLIKYDRYGNTNWVQTYNGMANDFDAGDVIALDGKGNIYITGHTTVLRATAEIGYTDLVTIKYNAIGERLWVTKYDQNDYDTGKKIAVDSAGNVYIAGVGESPFTSFPLTAITIKYNTAGVQQWVKTINSDQNGRQAGINDLALDEAGNVYITGGLYIQCALHYYTIKYNTNGLQQWMALHDGLENGSELASYIGLDENGNVFITARGSASDQDFVTIKYNADGMEKWVQRYNGPGGGGPDMATAIAVDKDGKVLVTGEITMNSTAVDYGTLKYNVNGALEWKKTYNGRLNDHAVAITTDAKGNVYVMGASATENGSDDYLTVKYDAYGNTKWGKKYNGPGDSYDEAVGVAVDDAGNVYVTGRSLDKVTGFDYATIKYDSNGVVKWVKRYDGPGSLGEYAVAIAVDKSGNVYVTGGSPSSDYHYNEDYATVKYDGNGNELWVARYNGPGNVTDLPFAMTLDALGNVYVTGESDGGASGGDFATVKYNSSGVQQWVASYEQPGLAWGRGIAVDATGNVYVTGGGNDVPGGGSDYTTIKYNAAGVQQWVALYDGLGNSDDYATALALDTSGNVYVTGGSSGDYATVKYSPSGVEQWAIRYDGPGHSDDVATGLALDASANVYVTGRSIGNGSDYDYATIKYEQTPLLTRSATRSEQSVAAVPARAPVTFTAKAFPNTFTNFINLQWSGSDKPVNITITDVAGKLVEKRTGLPSSGTLQTGNSFPQGIYFAEIVQGTDRLVLKLVKN